MPKCEEGLARFESLVMEEGLESAGLPLVLGVVGVMKEKKELHGKAKRLIRKALEVFKEAGYS